MGKATATLAACAAALAFAGCISPAPPPAANWAVEFWRAKELGGVETQGIAAPVEDAPANAASARKTARIAAVTVRAPYDGMRIAVLRDDGTIAFDPYNSFASAPSSMLRGAAQDCAEASGLFERVLPANSFAAADLSLEIVVTKLALDCRKDGRRDACVALALLAADGREALADAEGAGRASAGDGDYSAAFSRAFAKAMKDALGKYAGVH